MYHALLPPKTVKILKNEYHVRFFIVFVFFVSLAVLIATVFLLPSYAVSSLGERSAVSDAQSAKNGIATDTASITSGLSAAGDLVTALSSAMLPPLSPVVLRIAALRPEGITISSFNVSSNGPDSMAVSIQGLADTRSDLVTFKNILEGDQDFSGVTVPISDLASAMHIQFSMSMTATMKKQ